jgi:hypothetical protein
VDSLGVMAEDPTGVSPRKPKIRLKRRTDTSRHVRKKAAVPAKEPHRKTPVPRQETAAQPELAELLARPVTIPIRPVGYFSDENAEFTNRELRIRATAKILFNTDAAITEWLATPALALGGKKPIEQLTTEAGTAEVEGLLRGLAYGNFQ